MRYLLLVMVFLASVCPPVWARDLNANEKALAGSWIETSRYSDRLELFEDGTGKGVLGYSFDWKLLADNRLKVDAPVFGGMKISTSEPVDLREGFFYLDGREFIRYDPALEATYIELSRATGAAYHTKQEIDFVQLRLELLNTESDWYGNRITEFRKAIPAVEAASRECLADAGNALHRSPSFARGNLVETECRYNDLKYLELQAEARDRYPTSFDRLGVHFARGVGARLSRMPDSQADSGADLGEIWLGLISLGSLTMQLERVERNISYPTESLNKMRLDLQSLEGSGQSERGHGKNAAKQRSERIANLKRYIADSQAKIDKDEQEAKSIRAELDQKPAAIAATLAKQKKDQLDAIIAADGRALAAGLPPPRKAETLNALALIYATTDVPEVADGTKAVDAAKQALALVPRSPTYTSTLAAAYARAGDFAEAARVQQQAIDLLSPAASQDAERTAQQGRLDLYRQGKAIGGPSRSP